MVMFTFSVFERKYPFSGYLVQKIKIVSLNWNLVHQFKYAKFNGYIRFFCFWPKIPFLGKFEFATFKIVSLSWNLVSGIIWICKIQWWRSLFLFSTRNTSWANLIPKFKTVCLKWYLVTSPNRICGIQW